MSRTAQTKNVSHLMIMDVIGTAKLKITALWNLKPCSHLGITFCLWLVITRVTYQIFISLYLI
jgi:hypothetical protein